MEMLIFIVAAGLLTITFLYGICGGVKAGFLVAAITSIWYFINTIL